MIKIKSINLILLLSFLNNNLNSMQPSYLKESVNIKQDLNPIQVSDSEKNKPIEEDSVLLNLPEEIIQSIIHKITEPYIDKIKNIDHVFELYSIDIEQFKKKLKKELINLSLTSKRLRHSISYSIIKIRGIIKDKEKKLIDDIKLKYEGLDVEILNNILKDTLNKRPTNKDFLKLAVKLIIAGANANIKDKWGQTALILSRKNDYKDIVKLILNHKDIDSNIKIRYDNSTLSSANIYDYKI